jgi:hypothetical protein
MKRGRQGADGLYTPSSAAARSSSDMNSALPQNQNRFSGGNFPGVLRSKTPKAKAAGTEAGCNGFISFLRSKKLTAQKRHGGRF